ncbi:MAG: VTT domain-containing protein [candidate division WWE3 bacterium]|nr:VTT domain-containing protein [candidate division WWE3 bacterium]
MRARGSLGKFVKTNGFKRATVFLGIAFLVLTFLITLDPQPFLRFGYLGVFVFNLFGPGTLLIPTLARLMNIPLLAASAALGMALNDSVAWLIGKSSEVFVGRPQKLERVEKSIQKYGFWALFIWSLVPIPYDFVGFVAGYLGISYQRYILPSFLGKFVRFILMGYGTIGAVNFLEQ